MAKSTSCLAKNSANNATPGSSLHHRSRFSHRSRVSGFTLIEVLIALLVGATDYCIEPADLDVTRVRGTKNPDHRAIAELAPDLVVASSDNGSVTVALPRVEGGYDVRTSGDNNADVEVVDDPSSPRMVDLETDNGSITIRDRG